ncbi:MAG: thermonuclease family protein [Dehalococcoidia bacterium]
MSASRLHHTLPLHAFVYPARVLRVVDGDTLDLEIDVGFALTTRQRVRLLDAWAPEVRGPERALGLVSAGFVSKWVASHCQGEWPFRVQTEKDDAFGRYLAYVWAMDDGSSLADDLVDGGYATREKP